MLNVIYLNRAKADLIGIWRKTRETWGETQADCYLELIDETIARIAQFPEIGSPRDHIRQGYRIVRVLHERMDVDGKLA